MKTILKQLWTTNKIKYRSRDLNRNYSSLSNERGNSWIWSKERHKCDWEQIRKYQNLRLNSLRARHISKPWKATCMIRDLMLKLIEWIAATAEGSWKVQTTVLNPPQTSGILLMNQYHHLWRLCIVTQVMSYQMMERKTDFWMRPSQNQVVTSLMRLSELVSVIFPRKV